MRRGFTLIELLVVIAIIGVLSSVVLASLSLSRARAKDTAVRSEVRQMSTVMAQEHNESGDYSRLQVGWVFPAGSAYGTQQCENAPFSGPHAVKMVEICKAIIATNNMGVYVGSSSVPGQYSIMAVLPGKGTVFCLSSYGKTSDIEPASAASSWTSPGCSLNP
ncbi:MAG TPA: type II secretion system protein [Candidatus Paceibacterota bacterium]|jgi:prepilin-type N-terminal cleavage/methylation domain-containing protein